MQSDTRSIFVKLREYIESEFPEEKKKVTEDKLNYIYNICIGGAKDVSRVN